MHHVSFESIDSMSLTDPTNQPTPTTPEAPLSLPSKFKSTILSLKLTLYPCAIPLNFFAGSGLQLMLTELEFNWLHRSLNKEKVGFN